MSEFLVELYVSHADCGEVAAGTARFCRAAEEVAAEGSPVRLLRAIVVPYDETCFLLVEAATAEAVHEAARRAALPVERVVEATADLTNSNGREKR